MNLTYDLAGREKTYDNIGQLKTAIGNGSGGVTNRWQEPFGYGYDAAWNLNYRTNIVSGVVATPYRSGRGRGRTLGPETNPPVPDGPPLPNPLRRTPAAPG